MNQPGIAESTKALRQTIMRLRSSLRWSVKGSFSSSTMRGFVLDGGRLGSRRGTGRGSFRRGRRGGGGAEDLRLGRRCGRRVGTKILLEAVFQVLGRSLEVSEGFAERFCDFRQPLRAQADQGHDEDQHQPRHSNVEHGGILSAGGGRRKRTQRGGGAGRARIGDGEWLPVRRSGSRGWGRTRG